MRDINGAAVVDLLIIFVSASHSYIVFLVKGQCVIECTSI